MSSKVTIRRAAADTGPDPVSRSCGAGNTVDRSRGLLLSVTAAALLSACAEGGVPSEAPAEVSLESVPTAYIGDAPEVGAAAPAVVAEAVDLEEPETIVLLPAPAPDAGSDAELLASALKAKAEREAIERALEETRRAEEARRAETDRLAEEERLAEEARRAEADRLAEEERLAEEARRAEAERLAATEAERLAEEQRQAEADRLAEEERLAEEARRAEADRIAEEERLAEEARRAESDRLLEEARLQEEELRAEEERLLEEARQAEADRVAEEQRQAEADRVAEEQRQAEADRLAEEQRQAEADRVAEEQRQAEAERLAEEQRQAEAEPELGAASGDGMSFDDIEDAGLANACYLDDDHYAAEFLYQNPDVCFWEVDAGSERVRAVATPQAPAGAVRLPAPSGGDDTAAIESAINGNGGGAVVGTAGPGEEYVIGGLDIRVPIDIFDLPMRPAGNAGTVVFIHSPDVRIFGSPIDAKNSSVTHTGFRAEDGAHRFVLVESGFSNIRHRGQENASGVVLRGVHDFHLACNTFENIINDTSDSKKTARANSIWMNGGNDTNASGGVIVNNTGINHQSNGSRKDAEFFTIQSYSSTTPSKPVRIFANRTTDAGKRFTKHQENDAVVLSNDHRWTTKSGPLGDRKLQAHVEVQFSDNVIARNNRVKVGAGGRWDYIFHTNVNYGSKIQDNIHYDCNDLEFTDTVGATVNNSATAIVGRASALGDGGTYEATNSSANYNRLHGAGSVKYHFWFGEGYAREGGRFEAVGNILEVDTRDRSYK